VEKMNALSVISATRASAETSAVPGRVFYLRMTEFTEASGRGGAPLARTLMMVALLPRGLIGGLGEDPDAVSYPESKHASA
jgi:hypothetical protein